MKCTGRNCPMQYGTVNPSNCLADECPYVTKPRTNADKIRQMSDEELARFVATAQADILKTVGRALKYPGDLVRDCDLEDAADDWLDWLKQGADNG